MLNHDRILEHGSKFLHCLYTSLMDDPLMPATASCFLSVIPCPYTPKFPTQLLFAAFLSSCPGSQSWDHIGHPLLIHPCALQVQITPDFVPPKHPGLSYPSASTLILCVTSLHCLLPGLNTSQEKYRSSILGVQRRLLILKWIIHIFVPNNTRQIKTLNDSQSMANSPKGYWKTRMNVVLYRR